ncbi:hypothetical protein FA15DRAFT_690183 [Coprinopsis marcescibilis]|uniref:DUF803-domain-containing protein n=1 Tax=Coprinopsis marcescibilis TaxID=230819 RepID=A0A5C3LBK0_COPMA|nr:hypothetical protein FA15DRAFT_690183 [Coprinopsis marcescibilis]
MSPCSKYKAAILSGFFLDGGTNAKYSSSMGPNGSNRLDWDMLICSQGRRVETFIVVDSQASNGSLLSFSTLLDSMDIQQSYIVQTMDPNSVLSIPVGIIIGLLASFVQSLGLTIQRKSHVIDQSLPEHRRRVEHRRPLWLLGFTIFISSNVLGSLVQIASLPVVVLAPLGAVSLLWNAFFARLILGDVFSPWMILGTILIAGGAVLIAVFGIVPEPTRSLEDLLELFRRPAFAAYFSILAFLVVVSLASTHIAEYALSRKLAEEVDDGWDASALLSPSSDVIDLNEASIRSNEANRNVAAGSVLADERMPLLPDRKSSGTASPTSPNSQLESLNRTRIFIAISYASFSGILSGMCLIFAKSGVQLLLLTLGGQNQFWRWESWVLVLGLVVFALLQLWYLHKALVLADPTLVCPWIVILLCGVWVVTIQAGGGGVDVGSWGDEADNSPTACGEPLALDPDEQQDDETTLQATDSSKSVHPRIATAPMERETRSESNIPNVTSDLDVLSFRPAGPSRMGLDESPTSSIRLSHRLSRGSTHPVPDSDQHLPSLPSSPTLRSRSTLRQRLSSLNNELQRHTRGSSFHANHHGSLQSGPLSPPLNPTGFQIGLSPVSPGFAIMPVERRPRGLGLGGAPGSWEQHRRRTVSEGDIRGWLSDEEADGGRGHREGDDGEERNRLLGEETGTQEDQHTSNPSSGWTRWLGSVFRRKE